MKKLSLFLLISLLVVSCGKKEYKSLTGQDAGDRGRFQRENEERENGGQTSGPVLDSGKVALLVHNGTEISSFTQNQEGIVRFDLYIKNISNYDARDMVLFADEIAPFTLDETQYEQKCTQELKVGEECIIRLHIRNRVIYAFKSMELQYYNGLGESRMNLSILHRELENLETSAGPTSCNINEGKPSSGLPGSGKPSCGKPGVGKPSVPANDDDVMEYDEYQEYIEGNNQQCFDEKLVKVKAKAITNYAVASKFNLPYKLSSPNTHEAVSLIGIDDTNHLFRYKSKSWLGTKEKTERGVKDAMVLFSFELPSSVLKLPKNSKIADFKLKLEIEKIFSDSYPRTELLCLLGASICSGQRYQDPQFSHLINENFWHSPSQLRSSTFSNEVLKGYKLKGGLPISKIDLELDLNRTFNLVDHDLSFVSRGKNINFVIGDDVRILDNPKLYMTVRTYKPCD